MSTKAAYPFTSILEIMKPCKPDTRKKASHRTKLAQIMQSSDYIFEEKIDGIHGVDIGGRFYSIKISKNGLPSEKTEHIAHISAPLSAISSHLILDGEIYFPGKKSNSVVSITNSSPSKAAAKQIQQSQEGVYEPFPEYVTPTNRKGIAPGYLRYIVYDILRDMDGNWLVTKPFEERRAILEKTYFEHILPATEFIDLNVVHYDNFQERLNKILDDGREGAVLKLKNGAYYPGKRPMWNQIKLKQDMDDDVVIMGFDAPTRLYTGTKLESWPYWEGDTPVTENYYRNLIGSIQFGKYTENGELVQLGTVTGITDHLRSDMTLHPDEYIGRVMIIKAMEKTDDGKYRHANFLKFHPDKNAKECVLMESK